MELESARIATAGWYRDPRDQAGVRFHDGRRWTGDYQPGTSRMLEHRPDRRPRAAMTREELQHRTKVVNLTRLGQKVDVYL